MPATNDMRLDIESMDELSDTICSSVQALKRTSLENAESENDLLPEDRNAIVTRLLDACRDLMTKVSSPTETLKNMALIDKHNLVSLQIINHYRLAHLVPPEGTIGIQELALACKLDADALKRILRQAMTYQVFHEPSPGFISHTALSLEIPRLAPLLTYQLEVCLPSCLSLLPWLKRQDVSPCRAPFQIAHDTQDTWWEFAGKKPNVLQNYGEYMALITRGGPHDVSHVVNGFDWASLGNALVVDIGGADGFVGVSLAKAYPDLSIVVQDSSSLKAAANSRIPSELKERVVFRPHSFFDIQTVKHADIFLLRHILHDWEDESCVTILCNLTAIMKPTSRIIVAEQVLEQAASVDKNTERVMRALDMQMMVQFGGKERNFEDWKRLFHLADPRLELVSRFQPCGSADSFLELRISHNLPKDAKKGVSRSRKTMPKSLANWLIKLLYAGQNKRCNL